MAEFVLAENDVHVWHVPHEEHLPEVPRLRGLLSPDERERADRFHFERDRAAYTLSRAWLRLLVQAYGVAAAETVCFSYSPRGKPELDARHRAPWFQFNLAHTQGRTVFAFAHSRPVGIDVEVLRELHHADAIVKSVFAPEEQRAYQALAPERRQRGFYNGWTRKEAFLKATGDGLGRQLSSFAVTLQSDAPAHFLRIDAEPDGPGSWLLADLTLALPYVVALAMRGTALKIQNRIWPHPSMK